MDMWITYRLLDDSGEAGEQQRNRFTFPDTGEGFELGGQQIGYGPSIGQMHGAIRAHHNDDDADPVIVKTERA
ncbi:hypothetical protein ACQP25_44800 (plasmid) [Microtetraspora malaysiensis]|uniref:hypothetical protein n=1 Tax=Microtetraspora malaysiensis TaxID=161358 RepID=UPI003D933CB6